MRALRILVCANPALGFSSYGQSRTAAFLNASSNPRLGAGGSGAGLGGSGLGGLGGVGMATALVPPESGPSPDTWARLDAIMKVAARTGHSSFYVEKGRQVLGKSAGELGAQ